MLKVFLGYVVSVVVLLSSAWVVYPTYAASATVLITNIQAGAIGAATQEFIVIYNNSPEEIEITGWCLENKKDLTIACFIDSDAQSIFLPAGKYAIAASSSFMETTPIGSVTTIYDPISQSSGSITGSSDVITLVNSSGETVDTHSWTTSLSGGNQLERHRVEMPTDQESEAVPIDMPIIYQDTNMPDDWSVMPSFLPPPDQTRREDLSLVDICESIDGLQITVPPGMEIDETGACAKIIAKRLVITELLPNATGSDTGHEFIELFNPNDVVVELTSYRLLVGLAYEKSYEFPAATTIPARAYVSFSNSAIPFTLLNTTSRVALALNDGTIVSEVPVYVSPKADESWALIGDNWAYTNRPTPNLTNVPMSKVEVFAPKNSSTLKPCADNQYRSLETNRCRLVVPQSTKPKPCNSDQERNPDTGRCRLVAVSATPAPCKEGQARNSETNRCRTVVKMATADYGVLGAETKTNGNWYVLAAIVGLLLAALGYAVWEWRIELGKLFGKITTYLRRLARLNK